MATSSLSLFMVAFSLLVITVTARPCKTLFFFTTTTTSYFPNSQNPNPNFSLTLRNPHNSPRFLTLFFTRTASDPQEDDVRSKFVRIPSFSLDSPLFDRAEAEQVVHEEHSSVRSSVNDRAKDIMSVVWALLFGVGCGALTSAIMYLIWSLFWPNRFGYDDSEDDVDDGNLKKMGYVTVPSSFDEDLKKPAPAKEVV